MVVDNGSLTQVVLSVWLHFSSTKRFTPKAVPMEFIYFFSVFRKRLKVEFTDYVDPYKS